jgi:hypothetical protein
MYSHIRFAVYLYTQKGFFLSLFLRIDKSAFTFFRLSDTFTANVAYAYR